MEWSDPALRYAACWYCMTLHGVQPLAIPSSANLSLCPNPDGAGGWVLKKSAIADSPAAARGRRHLLHSLLRAAAPQEEREENWLALAQNTLAQNMQWGAHDHDVTV